MGEVNPVKKDALNFAIGMHSNRVAPDITSDRDEVLKSAEAFEKFLTDEKTEE